MRHETGRTAALLLALVTGMAHAADHPLRSDVVIGPLAVTPAAPADVTRQCDTRLAALEAQRASLESLPLTTPAPGLLSAYDDVYNLAVTTAYSEPFILKDTHPDAAIRKAAEECLQRASTALTALSMSRAIYERLKAIDAAALAPEMRYTVRRQIETFRRSGVDLEPEVRARIAALQDAITADNLEFERNVAADQRTISAAPEELAGLPADYLAAHPPGADGRVRITMAYPDVFPVMKYARSAELRRRLQQAFLSRAHPANDAVLGRLLERRAELANLLGYRSYAEYSLANQMAQSPERARSFLDSIAASARPAAQADAARMLARLRKDDPGIAALDSASTQRATTLIRKEDYAVDPQQVREYFRYDKVRNGIFGLVRDLFLVEIRPAQSPTWHPDVEAYELVEGGRTIGHFYLDMHPRDGKFTHARMSVLRIGIRDRVVPAAALITNFPKGLMEHGDVVTFLHEFGHLVHFLFAGQLPYAMQNPLEIENDVLEAPSQLLEEWVWDYETLRRFATNEAGEPIPRELVERMNGGRRFAEAFQVTRQLGLAAVSLDFYASDLRGKDLSKAYAESFNRYSIVPNLPGTHPQSAFAHLTDYGAAYYTYQWSMALASDLLTPFHAAGLRDSRTARRYRETILAPGGSQSMHTLARDFLGRDWSAAAYRTQLERGTGSAAGR